MKIGRNKPAQKIGCYLNLERSLLQQALNMQKKLAHQGIHKRLGEILFDDHTITAKELEAALHQQRLDRMHQYAIFASLDREKIERLSALISETVVFSGDEFIRQDTTGDCFYLIVSGVVLVFRRDEYEEEIPLEVLKMGESIGEMGYFSDGKRSASVRAQEKTLLFRIYYRDLNHAFRIAPELAVNFLNSVTERLRRSNLRFEDTIKKTRFAEKSLKSLHDFLDISEIISLKLGIEDLIERVVLMAGKVMNADRATLFLVDRLAEQLWSMVAEGEVNKEIRIPIDSGIAGWVAQHEQVLNIQNAYQDTRFNPEIDRQTGYRTLSILCGPVINLRGELIGVIQVINKKTGTFQKQDEFFFKIFSNQIAVVLENFYLSQRMMVNYEKMSTLLDVVTSASQTLDLSSVINFIVQKISEVLDAERSSLFLLDKETGRIWSRVAQGLEVAEMSFARDEGLAGYVVSTGRILNIRNAYEDGRFNPEMDRKTGFITRTVLCMPLQNREGEIIGVTEVMNKRSGVFDKDDEDLLKAMSAQIAVILENAQLFERVVSMKNYLQSIVESISNSILTLDDNYRIITANGAALKLFQKSHEALTGHDLRDFIGPENGVLLRHVQKVYESHGAVVDHDLEMILTTGITVSVNINFVPLIGSHNEYQGQVLVFEDIRQEKRMKSTLLRYMGRDIVEKVLNDPDRVTLGGVRSMATVLFSDIRGFTAIAEKMTAEKTVDLLNECFSLLVDILFKHNGVLDKYIGDAIMAVFGVPYPQPDDAIRAVRTALEMHTALGQFNAHRQQCGLERIDICFGLATGEVVSGNIGSEKRMEFTVIGDDVNISQYLEKLNRKYGTSILVSESTKMAVGDHFVTRPVDRILFKGKKNAVNVYEIIGEKGCNVHPALTTFCEGLTLYHQQDFHSAGRLFALVAADDPLSNRYLNRCRYFLENPPPPDWSGFWDAPEI